MYSAEQRLDNSLLELQQDIFNYFSKLSEVEEKSKKRTADSAQRVKTLETQLRQAEEREGQLNNQWAPIEAARQQSLQKIYENLLGQNAVYQKFEQQLAQPPQRYHDEKSSESVNEIYDRVLHEQRISNAKH